MGVHQRGRVMSNRCSICAYSMPHPPVPYNICPCCGVEYGVDDAFDSHEQLREEWLRRGAPWFSDTPAHPKPENWNPWVQFESAGYPFGRPVRFEAKKLFGSEVSTVPFASLPIVLNVDQFFVEVRTIGQPFSQAGAFVESGLHQRKPPSSAYRTVSLETIEASRLHAH